MPAAPSLTGLDEARGRLAYINQHRELTLALALAAALLGHLLWPAALPSLVPGLLAIWWVGSIGFVRISVRIDSEALLHGVEFAYFLLELILLTGIARSLGAVGWLAVLFYCCTILYANLALPAPSGVWITGLAWLFFTALVFSEYLRWSPPPAWVDWGTRPALSSVAGLVAGAAAAFVVVGYSSAQFGRMLSAKSEALEAANRELRIATQELRHHQNHLEELVRQRTHDLAAAGDELRRANAELQRLNEAKTHFLSNVSHELRTPLTSIRSFSELLLNYPNESLETRTEFLEIIKNESDRLTRLVNDVLDLAKIEAGRMQWRFQPVQLEEVIRVACDAMRGWAEAKGLELWIAAEPGLPSVRGDFDRLVQVVTNLLSNAFKFTEHGYVQAGARQHQNELLLFVADTGHGIPAAELESIFEQFHQGGDALISKPQGTGLGLSICREIIQFHHGRIWAESEEGRGSTFYCSLPLAEAAPPAGAPPIAKAEGAA